MKFPFSNQTNNSDCGPTCLKMVAAYYGQHYELEFLKKKCKVKKAGVSMLDISRTARAIGFHCRGVKMETADLRKIVQQIPVILHWNEQHFVVVYKAPKKKTKGMYHIADPGSGLKKIGENKFKEFWISKKSKKKSKRNARSDSVGFALLIEPSI